MIRCPREPDPDGHAVIPQSSCKVGEAGKMSGAGAIEGSYVVFR